MLIFIPTQAPVQVSAQLNPSSEQIDVIVETNCSSPGLLSIGSSPEEGLIEECISYSSEKYTFQYTGEIISGSTRTFVDNNQQFISVLSETETEFISTTFNRNSKEKNTFTLNKGYDFEEVFLSESQAIVAVKYYGDHKDIHIFTPTFSSQIFGGDGYQKIQPSFVVTNVPKELTFNHYFDSINFWDSQSPRMYTIEFSAEITQLDYVDHVQEFLSFDRETLNNLHEYSHYNVQGPNVREIPNITYSSLTFTQFSPPQRKIVLKAENYTDDVLIKTPTTVFIPFQYREVKDMNTRNPENYFRPIAGLTGTLNNYVSNFNVEYFSEFGYTMEKKDDFDLISFIEGRNYILAQKNEVYEKINTIPIYESRDYNEIRIVSLKNNATDRSRIVTTDGRKFYTTFISNTEHVDVVYPLIDYNPNNNRLGILTANNGVAVFEAITFYPDQKRRPIFPDFQNTVKVHRFFNSVTGGYLYTPSLNERDTIIQNLSNVWLYEGEKFSVFSERTDAYREFQSPVYRFFNTTTGTHFYTTSKIERDSIIQNLTDFNYEGESFMAFNYRMPNIEYVTRLFDTQTGIHLFTSSNIELQEIARLESQNYQNPRFINEGAAFGAPIAQ